MGDSDKIGSCCSDGSSVRVLRARGQACPRIACSPTDSEPWLRPAG